MACQPPVAYADPKDVSQLAEPLRSRIAQAIADAPTGGLILVSGKRTDYQQWLLRHDRVPGHECDPAYKGHPTTAVPGRSHHRNLSATICAADMGGRDLDWLIDHERDYGLFRAVKGEKWHFEPKGTPTVPITPYGQHTAPNEGREWVPFHPGDHDLEVYARGGFDNEVSELQIRLVVMNKAHPGVSHPGRVDGDYGPTTVASVRSFKRWVIALQRSTKQKPWPNDDGLVGSKTIGALRFWTA